jgi:regulatory protein
MASTTARLPSLRSRALACLALREHSRAELARKLADASDRADRAGRDAGNAAPDDDARAARQAAIEALLDEFQASGLLSDERYVASVLHRRAPRLGAARIRQELRAKGVPEAMLRDSLQGLAASEETRAREVWQRRYGSMPAADARETARQMRFLMARGFSAAVVQRVLRQPQAPDESGHDDRGQHDDVDG